ncbi:hypothetical protein HK097_010185 [Rhizophlyctis rosea]|uniref:Bacteriophage/plasmid primase P4 C-terminal domain-containing protein n=1 Tax=Rhizophlyctis rosea TaxID=64517 RepID=A0AAD5SB57_9FUNG|nr:hypothetical protein HK097_010185 [Rhizophlyctis rosea]
MIHQTTYKDKKIEDATMTDDNTDNGTVPTLEQENVLKLPLVKYEYICDTALKQLLTSPLTLEDHKKDLRRLKSLRCSENLYRVEYIYGKKCEDHGRLVGKGLQMVRSRTTPYRQFLCGRQYHDIDQVNSTPTLYLHLVKNNVLSCPQLEDYIANREECLKRWRLDKWGFLALLNCTNIAAEHPPEVHAIHDLLYQKLRPILMEQYPDIWQKVKLSRDPKTVGNRSGVFMSHVMFVVEGETLLAMHNFFNRGGWFPDVLMFDGLQVRRQSPDGAMPEDILRACKEEVRKVTGVQIRLAEKPMDVPESFLTERKLTIPDKWVAPMKIPDNVTIFPDGKLNVSDDDLDIELLRKIPGWENFDFRRVHTPTHKNAAEWYRELRGNSIMKHSSGTLFVLGEDSRWRMDAVISESDVNLQIADVLVANFRKLLQDVEDHEQTLNLERLRPLFNTFHRLIESSDWSSAVTKNVARKQKEDDSCINLFLSRPELFAFEDGVYDLFIGEFRPLERDDYILHTCGYDFPGKKKRNPKIRDHIMRFYTSIFRTEAERDYRLLIVARSCYGLMVEEIYMIEKDDGRNGKGTEATLIGFTLGNYFQAIESKNFTGYSSTVDSPNSQLFKCLGKRWVSTAENRKTDKFNSLLLKSLSGRDPFTVRDLRGKCITFPFTGMIHIQCNDDIINDQIDKPLVLRKRALSYPFQFIQGGGSGGEAGNGDDGWVEGDPLLKELDPTLKDCFMSTEYRDEFIMMLFDLFRNKLAKNNLRIETPAEVMQFTHANAFANLPIQSWFITRYKLTGRSRDTIKRADAWKMFEKDVKDRKADHMDKSSFFDALKSILTLRQLRGTWVFEGVTELREDVKVPKSATKPVDEPNNAQAAASEHEVLSAEEERQVVAAMAESNHPVR